MPQAVQFKSRKQPHQPSQNISRGLTGFRLLFLLAILVVFGRTMLNDFVDWDDTVLIIRNPYIKTPTLRGLAHEWNPNDPATYYMYDPLVYTTWWTISHGAQLQYTDTLNGTLNPQIFHGANLIVHWLTACVVFEILRRIGLRDWPAAAATALFALHPMQTEPVAWATGMKDLLAGLFSMLTIWRYIVAVQSEGKQRRKNYWLASFLYLCALLSKPSTVVVPLIVAAFDRALYRRNWKLVFKWISPWLVLSLLTTALAMKIQTMPAVFATPAWTRPLVGLDTLAFYIYKIVLPFYLSFDYGRTPAALLGEPSLHHPLYWSWIVPIVVALLIWKINRREITLGALIFLISIAPVLGLTPFTFQYYSTVADRFVYVAMLGVAIAFAYLLQHISKKSAKITVAIVLPILSCLSFAQAGVWYDSASLYEHGAASVTRGSAVHFEILGQYQNMVAHFAWLRAQAAKTQYDYPEYKKQMDIAGAQYDQAIENYEKAMRLEPKDGLTYDQLGFALAFRARWNEAIDVQQRRIDNQINLRADFREEPDKLYDTLGMLCAQAGRYDEAIPAFQRSLKFKQSSEVQDRLNRAIQKRDATRPSTQPVG
jgi:protein O-mannosyl-transferase